MNLKPILIVTGMVLVVNLTVLVAPQPAMAASCTWTGTVNTDWATAGNWSNCPSGTPSSSDTVTINSATYQPQITNADVTIAGLTLNSGASLTIAVGRTLTVNGDITLNADGGATTTIDNAGTLVATTGTFTTHRSNAPGTAGLTLSGSGTWTVQDVTTRSNTKLTISGSPTIHVKGDVHRAGSLDPGTSTIIFDSGGTQRLTGGSQHYFYNLEIASGTTLQHTTGGSSGVHIRNNFTNNGILIQDSGAEERRLQFDYASGYPTSSMFGSGVTNVARIVIEANKTVNAGSHSITIDSNDGRVPWDNKGTFNGDSASVTFNGSSTADATGAGVNNFNDVVIAGTFSAGNITMNVAGNWTNNGTFNAGTGTVTFNGTSEQTIGGSSATAFNNLTINNGATVVLPPDATASALTNNGTIKQTRDVNGNTNVTFAGIGGYGGITINANNLDLGSTLVAIRGNQACDANDTMVHRCYDITPAVSSGRNAIITFYFANSELNGLSCTSLDAWHWTGTTWEQAGLAGPRQCSSEPYSLQVTGVTSFSTFGLGAGGGPTIIRLSDLKVTSQSAFKFPSSWERLLLGLGLIAVAAGLLTHRRRPI